MDNQRNAAVAAPRDGSRIIALDGLRGSLSAAVVISHFFGEVPNRVPGLSLGWIAVIIFFTLSGFLVGRMILDKAHHANFLAVFLIRRACRIVPLYFLWTIFVFALVAVFAGAPWLELGKPIPLWAYLTFTQNVFMAANDDLGHYWISQSWSLGIEEHFYLLAPLLLILTPRRWLASVLMLCIAGSVGFRALVFVADWHPMLAQVTLPGRADALCLGLLIAVLFHSRTLPFGWTWPQIVTVARILPVLALPIAGALLATDIALGRGFWFQIFAPFFVAIGAAGYITAIARGAPEGERFKSPTLQFFGSISYAVFLTHLGVVGLMHGLLLGTAPDLATPAQWFVTLLSLPVVILVGWALSRSIQDPLTAYGRHFAWSDNTMLPVTKPAAAQQA